MKKKLMLMCAALLPLASCGLLDDGKDNPPSEGDNFVTVSVSDVRDGYFKLNFECGEGTQTIEYAVCRAVNMKTDSVAFKAGELDGVQRVEPVDGKVSLEYDCSEPLDFGPYTVYARAISTSGEVSAPAKAQVCALTTGVTVEYVSRAMYKLKASYHGNGFIVNMYRQSKNSIYSMMGSAFEASLDGFIDFMLSETETSSWIDVTTPMFVDGQEYNEQMFYEYDYEETPYLDDQLLGFVVSDGTKITGAYAFEIPLQDIDQSVPLPDSIDVEIDFSSPQEVEGGGYVLMDLLMGNNTERYYWGMFNGCFYVNPPVYDEDSFWYFIEDLKETNGFNVSNEEAAKLFFTCGGFGSQNIVHFYCNTESTFDAWFIYHEKFTNEEYYYPKVLIAVYPVNWNNEGFLQLFEIDVPEELLRQ